MSSSVKERFRGQVMTADSTVVLGGNGISGFLAKTSGTITVSYPDGSNGTSITTITAVDAVPVTEGFFTLIPLNFAQLGGTITLAGGASGTLFT